MNIVIVSAKHGVSRSLKLHKWMLVSLLLSLVVAPLSIGAWGYYVLAQQQEQVFDERMAKQWMAELQQQREEVARIKQDANEQLDALTLRMAELQARLIRLDALGERLTEVAKLDTAEFSFDQVPAVGGPIAISRDEPYRVPEFIEVIDALTRQIEEREQQLEVIDSLLGNRQIEQEVFIAGRPIKKGWLSSHFGKRTDPFTGKPAWHEGVDFAGKEGSDIIAVAAGVVTWSGPRYGYGQLVEINHGGGYTTRYAHCKELLVKVGDIVQKGETIALMGSTGRSTGPHVHFEVRKYGRALNPVRFVNRASR